MKKLLSLLALVLVIALACCVALADDDSTDKGIPYENAGRVHEVDGHDVTFDKIVVEPKCLERGIARYTCNSDNSHFHEVFILALGHNWGEWKVTTPATEEKEGVETRICKNDSSHTETRSIPKLEKKQDTSGDKKEDNKKPDDQTPEVTPDKPDDTTPEVTPEKPDEISPEVTQEKPDEPKLDSDSTKDDESKQDSSQSVSPAVEPVGSEFASYQGVDFYKDDSGDVRCYTNGVPVINDFKCDGEFTYFFQADGTAMKDRLTYHPDGEHVIYFDAEGHEVFSDFANVKKTIAGEDVNDFCFFNVFGYMYVDVLTYDKTGTYLYYANPYGVMEMGKWFQFSDKVMWADGREGDEFKNQYGCANADGTLMTNTQTIDWEGRSCYLQGNGVALY